MRDGGPPAAPRHGACPGQEGSLTDARFVGSYPAADFRLVPVLPELTVVGRSNVGKSSLINAFLGRRALARTSRTPGKTRLCNVYAVDERYYLVDLPGYGYARVSQRERVGFRRLMRDVLVTRPQVVGVLWLLDIRHPPSPDDHAMHTLLAECGLPVLLAVTKADKIPRSKRSTQVRTILDALEFAEDQCVITSAESKQGIPELRDAVAGLTAPPAGSRR